MSSMKSFIGYMILSAVSAEIGPIVGGQLGTTISVMGVVFALMVLSMGARDLIRAVSGEPDPRL